MDRIAPIKEGQLTDDLGFHARCLYCGHVANLIQYIKDGFETCKITGLVIDTYPKTSNNFEIINIKMVQIISSLLENNFFVKIDGQKSRWHAQ